MNYVKKMCILRQAKQGFSGDGKPLSGLVKIEQYGKNLAVEVSIINFAPLCQGEYYCFLSDGKQKTEMLSLRGKSLFNILSDMDISDGFCAVVCYVKTEIVPIAYGINGNGKYDWKSMLNKALPPVFPVKKAEMQQAKTEESIHAYDDESITSENYYQEKTDEQELSEKDCENAYAESANQSQGEKEGVRAAENGDADRLLHPFATDPDGYYLQVKNEVDALFDSYPKDDTLCGVFSCSEWVRLKGTKAAPEYLVGVVYENDKARYICYALKAQDKNNPPTEIKNVCTFVPKNVFTDADGFFVLFQSATTGECIKPDKA